MLAFRESLIHSHYIADALRDGITKKMKNTEQLRRELATKKLEALAKKVRPNPRKPGEDVRSYCARLRTV
jgi:hypothetical protein